MLRTGTWIGTATGSENGARSKVGIETEDGTRVGAQIGQRILGDGIQVVCATGRGRGRRGIAIGLGGEREEEGEGEAGREGGECLGRHPGVGLDVWLELKFIVGAVRRSATRVGNVSSLLSFLSSFPVKSSLLSSYPVLLRTLLSDWHCVRSMSRF